jgi:Anti-sigma-28 factor, FlgM
MLRPIITAKAMETQELKSQELKSLVEAGTYKPDPAQIAMAMLSRRGVRELLTGINVTTAGSGHTPEPPVVRPRAA